MAVLEVALLKLRLVTKVAQTTGILNFGNTNQRTSQSRQQIGTHISKNCRHIEQLMLISHFCPPIPAIRQVFIIALTLVVLIVE